MKIQTEKNPSYLWNTNIQMRKVTPYLFIAPHLILFIIFFLIPAIFGLYISLTKWDLFGTPVFVGFDNFREILFNQDSTFYKQLRIGLSNTITFVLMCVPFAIIIPLLIAIGLHAKPKGSKVFQAIFYAPSLLSIASVVLAWQFMFHRTLGPINNILNIKFNWFGQQPFTWIAIVIVTVWWGVGGNMIIYLAAISGISKELYEAASTDGANKFQQFVHITLPGIINPLAYTTVLTTIAQFNIYGQPLMLTGGGPRDSTRVLLMYIREHGFGTGGSIAGIASAMAIILGLCIMVVSVIQFILIREKD